MDSDIKAKMEAAFPAPGGKEWVLVKRGKPFGPYSRFRIDVFQPSGSGLLSDGRIDPATYSAALYDAQSPDEEGFATSVYTVHGCLTSQEAEDACQEAVAYESDCCPKTGGEHMPDWSTVRPADGSPGIVDIWCSACGLSGSAAINPDDIQWEAE